MINHTKEYRKQTGGAVLALEEKGELAPKLMISTIPLKVNGDERFVIHATLEGNSPIRKGLASGTAVHNPVDDFDPTVGILLASSRAYSDYAKRLKESAYHIMMGNAERQKVHVQALRIAKVAHELCKDPDAIIRKEEAHRARLIAALDQDRVFYCPACKGHFANDTDIPFETKPRTLECPHCKVSHTRKYWRNHKLDEFKLEKEAADGEKGTVHSDPLP